MFDNIISNITHNIKHTVSKQHQNIMMINKEIGTFLLLSLSWIEISTGFVTGPCSRFKAATSLNIRAHPSTEINHQFKELTLTSLHESNQDFENTESNQDQRSIGNESLSDTFNAVRDNLLDGEIGKRGEIYFFMQLGLVFCILFGTVPLFGNLIEIAFGPGLVLIGGSVATIGAVQLGTNLTPWPQPPKDGTLVTDGTIFDQIRHPIYSGLLGLMFGLSIWSGSAIRLLLCVALFYLLDYKSELEEEELIKKFGMDYIDYRESVQGKFIPYGLTKLIQDVSKTVLESEA